MRKGWFCKPRPSSASGLPARSAKSFCSAGPPKFICENKLYIEWSYLGKITPASDLLSLSPRFRLISIHPFISSTQMLLQECTCTRLQWVQQCYAQDNFSVIGPAYIFFTKSVSNPFKLEDLRSLSGVWFF